MPTLSSISARRPTVDVVIPVHNNAETIEAVLSGLQAQLSQGDRVHVVDDGSTDDTLDRVRSLLRGEAKVPPFADRECSRLGDLCLYRTAHQGPAAARNAGLRNVSADIVLFLGGDTLPATTLLERHRAIHVSAPEDQVACLGSVTWDTRLPPTPFMVWLEHGGPQNAYGEIAGTRWADIATYCYGSNLSLKRAVIERLGGFDATNFPSYGCEDADVGLRLKRLGVRLRYEPAAKVFHAHRHTVETFLTRQRSVGASTVILARLHPDSIEAPLALRRWYRVSRRLLYPLPLRWILTSFAYVAETRWILPRLYANVTGWAFTDGVQDGLRTPKECCG